MLKRKIRFFVSLLLTISMFTTASPVVYAHGILDMDEFSEEEWRRIEMIINSPNSKDWIGVVKENVPLDSGISTYPNCVDCAVLSVSVCAKEAILYEEGYHNDFWGINQTDCYAYYFESGGAEMCPLCARVIFMYGRHACWEIHKKCWYGEYDVCPMKES
ncbi:hypothetical protein [uncultured Acetatifactor sp.]|jgi:ferredoxin|uniref:hypothetical protein n=1 Tax=uncultured Acetatifactor sp. TaxID=1671927 RepID=UPI002632CA03|nr:hypothetical protein [uncultured Acetatifactor sp.]